MRIQKLLSSKGCSMQTFEHSLLLASFPLLVSGRRCRQAN